MSWEDRVRAAFDGQGLMHTFHAELAEMTPGAVALRAPIRPEVCQHDGFAHAALAFALGDNAGGFSALSLMPEGHRVLTVEMKINLTAPARGRALIARGRVERAGRTLTVVRAEVSAETDAGEVVVALMQGTMIGLAP